MSTQNRGFGTLDPETRRRLASKGGKAAHASGRAFKWTSDEARDAGRKGGVATRRRHEAVSPDAIGKKR